MSYETSTRFAKKVPEDNTYEKFICIANNAGLGNQEIIVFMSFNAKTIKKPFGKNGKFTAARRGKYGKLMRRFFGTEESTGSTPNALKDKLFIVSVRTVEKDEKQRRLRKEERYSVIDKIVDS